MCGLGLLQIWVIECSDRPGSDNRESTVYALRVFTPVLYSIKTILKITPSELLLYCFLDFDDVELSSDPVSTQFDADCPIHTITVQCIAQTSRESLLHQIWYIEIPKMMPIFFSYNTTSNSSLDVNIDLDVNITAVLTRLTNTTISGRSLQIIESNITLMLSNLDGTIIDCSTDGLVYQSIMISLNTSGMH